MSEQTKDGNLQHGHIDRGAKLFETPDEKLELERIEAAKREGELKARELFLSERQYRVNRWMVIFSGVLTVSTVITGWLTYRQAKLAEKSSEAAVLAAKATADSAYDACLGAQIARSALIES